MTDRRQRRTVKPTGDRKGDTAFRFIAVIIIFTLIFAAGRALGWW